MTFWSPVQIHIDSPSSTFTVTSPSETYIYSKRDGISSQDQTQRKIAENMTQSRVLLTKFEVFVIVTLKILC